MTMVVIESSMPIIFLRDPLEHKYPQKLYFLKCKIAHKKISNIYSPKITLYLSRSEGGNFTHTRCISIPSDPKKWVKTQNIWMMDNGLTDWIGLDPGDAPSNPPPN